MVQIDANSRKLHQRGSYCDGAQRRERVVGHQPSVLGMHLLSHTVSDHRVRRPVNTTAIPC